jgi:hypothetical protein
MAVELSIVIRDEGGLSVSPTIDDVHVHRSNSIRHLTPLELVKQILRLI